MSTKGLEGDISTSIETTPEKSTLFQQMALDKRYFKNFTLQDILEGFPHDRSILIRIDVSENGRRTEISIVEEL